MEGGLEGWRGRKSDTLLEGERKMTTKGEREFAREKEEGKSEEGGRRVGDPNRGGK